MSGKFWNFVLWFSMVLFISSFSALELKNYLRRDHRQNVSLLIDFTCAVAKDELEKHPEMQTVAMIELENNFPADFSKKVLKCLPRDVTKLILNPQTLKTFLLPKQSMIIYAADKVSETFQSSHNFFHLSKRLIVSTKVNETSKILTELLNVVQIYEENRKVIARRFDRTKNLTNFETFENAQHENLSQILFPDKAKYLNGQTIYAVNTESPEAHGREYFLRPNCKWSYFLDIIAEKLNATLHFSEIYGNRSSYQAYINSRTEGLKKRIKNGTLDFYLNYLHKKFDLESYFALDWCFLALLPPEYSITDQILFLPLDKSCWMWLGITIAVSTFVWRISEGHWNFCFGAFAHLVGQSQLVDRIQTSCLTMKILLQILILAFFIFSNGYQSLVTSFMLQPVRQNLLKTIEEVFDSDLNIEYDKTFEEMHQNNPKYQRALKDGRIGRFNPHGKNWYLDFARVHFVDTQPCSLMKHKIERKGDGKSWRKIYQIPEPALSLPEDLMTRPFHPYIDKFQELMDQTFEVGLPEAWERFYFEILDDRNNLLPSDIQKPEEKAMLEFDNIAPFFLILAVGFVAALLTLFCEIFYHDLVAELMKGFSWKKIGNYLKREIEIE